MKNLIKKGVFLQALFMLISGIFIHGDGFIVVPRDPRPLPHPRPHFNPFPLEVKYHNVDVKIEDMVATTTIDQVFFNPTRYRMEGYYLFPVPARGVIKKFSMLFVHSDLLSLMSNRQIKKMVQDFSSNLLM